MPLQGLTSGIDATITFTNVNGLQKFAILENFTAGENADINTDVAINGQTYFPKFHKGWHGSFTLMRNSNNVDLYFELEEASYYLGNDQLPMTITLKIKEVDGSISQSQWTNCVLKFEDIGSYTGQEIVRQNISWMGSRRQETL